MKRGKACPERFLVAVDIGTTKICVLVAQQVSDAEVDSWQDIDRLDVRPGKGIVKVQCKNRWEIQIDLQTGEVLSSSYRRSDLIESLHDGSFFSSPAKLWIFLPSGILLLGLWITGAYLWWLPIGAKRKKKRKQNSKTTGVN